MGRRDALKGLMGMLGLGVAVPAVPRAVLDDVPMVARELGIPEAEARRLLLAAWRDHLR